MCAAKLSEIGNELYCYCTAACICHLTVVDVFSVKQVAY